LLGPRFSVVRPGAAPVTGEMLVAMEELNHGDRDPHLDFSTGQLMRHAV
jgi:hypothetical protein